MRILFWDIDGTLINNDRAGMYAWLQALSEEHGEEVTADGMVTAGLTDVRIARIAVEQMLGRDWDERLARRLLAGTSSCCPSGCPAGRTAMCSPTWSRCSTRSSSATTSSSPC